MVTHLTLCFTQNYLPSSLHAVASVILSLSGSPLPHSSLSILCNGTVCSPELHLFSVKCSEQGEWAAFIPAACAQNLTQRGNKSQITKHITSIKQQNSLLYSPHYRIIYPHWNTGQLFKCLLAILLRKTMTSSDKTENHNSVFPVQD